MKNEQQPTKQNSSSRSTTSTDSQPNQDSKENAHKNNSSAKSPIKEADKIVNESRDTRDKEYGGFSASMKRMAVIASELCNKEITPEDAFKCMMALKLSRMSYSSGHFDSHVDLIGYVEGMWNYNQEQNQPKKITELDNTMKPGEQDFFHIKNAPIQAMNGAQIFLDNLAKTLTSAGYRVFPPEAGHSFTESMDWKDQDKRSEGHYTDFIK
jgi:hypothetical protein